MSPFVKEFEIFQAVYQDCSVSNAANRLSMDQGNLSKILQRLEKTLQTKFFIRYRGGMKPTPEADELYNAISAMSDSWDKLRQGGFSGETPKSLRIGMHASLGHTYLGKIMSYFRVYHPDVFLDIHFETSLEITRKVQKREIDLAVVANPIKSEDLIIKNFALEKIVLCSLNSNLSSTILLHNPQMLFSSKIVHASKFKKVINIFDYDVAAGICERDQNFCCIVPSTVQERYSKLKVLQELKDAIGIKIITYPGSQAKGFISEIINKCLKTNGSID